MELYATHISDEIIAALIKKIREKKELKNVDERWCREKIKRALAAHKKTREMLSRTHTFDEVKRNAEIKKLVKEIRACLRTTYGLYQCGETEKARQMLNNRSKVSLMNELLKLHVSTRERLPYYKKFFAELFQIVGPAPHILDLGCGYNPMALPFMQPAPKTYHAIELYYEDVALIKKYFNYLNARGWQTRHFTAETIDLEKKQERGTLFKKQYDLVLALKLFDLLKKKTVEDLVKNLRTAWLVASFPTTTIAGTRMNVPRRGWFQKMLRRLGYAYTARTYENEMVYFIKKTGAQK